MILPIDQWNIHLASCNISDGIDFVLKNIKGKKVFSTSFGIEDQMLIDLLSKSNSTALEVFTIDTGRLFPDTYDVFERSQRKYSSLPIKVYFPDEKDIREYVNEEGVNGFYTSIERRKRCCHIRKVVPLQRALQGASLWITGLRSEQSQHRGDKPYLEWDEKYQLIKYHPLINQHLQQVQDYIKTQNIPINSLYKKGYLSIGCAPCTRALLPGEDFRAGRWWWEQGQKECGLHSVKTEK